MKTLGVGVFVKKGNRLLLGRRGPKCKWGANCLALPGGHVNDGELIRDAAIREVLEETGMGVSFADVHIHGGFSVPGLLSVTDHGEYNQPEDQSNHLSFWLLTTWQSGNPQIMEPDKCIGWQWMTADEIMRIPGGDDRKSVQYYWTPLPLWRQILRPYFPGF